MKKKLLIFSLLILVFDANSQNSHLKIKALIDSTYNYIDTSNNTPKRFTNFSTKDSLFKIGVVYNKLRPQLLFERFNHLTFNIFYQGNDTNEFSELSDKVIKTLCREIDIEKNSYDYDLVCVDNLIDNYIYVDLERMHIHYENFVGNHTSQNRFKVLTYFNERSGLKSSISKFSIVAIDSNIISNSNLRWLEISINNHNQILTLDVDEYLGEKKSVAYRRKIRSYKISLASLISKKIDISETEYKNRINWQFSEKVVELEEYNSDGEVINSIKTDNFSTICLNNNIELNKELFNSLKAYLIAANINK